MNLFFRFPHTPHLAWLGAGMPRDDKVLSPEEANTILAGSIVVEEKLDGANLGLSIRPDGQLRAQNRGQYLLEPYSGQFTRLTPWLAQQQFALLNHLDSTQILFGEWCAARHSLDYETLPDWFLLFDVYDRMQKRFWSSTRRNALAASLGLAVVPQLFRGRATLADLKTMLQSRTSLYRSGPPEGLVIRAESEDWCESRAKLVQPEFTQAIGEHWRSRAIEWNRLRLFSEPES